MVTDKVKKTNKIASKSVMTSRKFGQAMTQTEARILYALTINKTNFDATKLMKKFER